MVMIFSYIAGTPGVPPAATAPAEPLPSPTDQSQPPAVESQSATEEPVTVELVPSTEPTSAEVWSRSRVKYTIYTPKLSFYSRYATHWLLVEVERELTSCGDSSKLGDCPLHDLQ